MKFLLIITIIVLTFQQNIIHNVREKSCSGKLLQGYIFPNQKCVQMFDQSFSIYKNQGSKYDIDYNCNSDCSSCKKKVSVNYNCTITFNAFESYFGNPAPISKRGFIFALYPREDRCKANFDTVKVYHASGDCINEPSTLGLRSSSTKIFWSKKKDGVVVKEFVEKNCKGILVSNRFFGANECVDLGGFIIKAMKSL